MPETLSVQIQRWPKPPPDGPGGVFTSHMQMAEAMGDLKAEHNYRCELKVGDGVQLQGTYFLELFRNGDAGVRADIDQHLLVYYLGVLRALTAAEYEDLSGSAP